MLVEEITYTPELKNIIKSSIAEAINNGGDKLNIDHIFNSYLNSKHEILSEYFSSNKSNSVFNKNITDIAISQTVKNALKKGHKIALENNSKYVNANHLLLALLDYKAVKNICEEKEIPIEKVKAEISEKIKKINKNNKSLDINNLQKNKSANPTKEMLPDSKDLSKRLKTLVDFCSVLSYDEHFNNFDCFEREKEIAEIYKIFSQKENANALILGDPGVGKTNLIYGFVKSLAKNEHSLFNNSFVMQLDLPSVIAGCVLRGEFEERLKKILQIISEMPNCFLFIDEFHSVFNMGSNGENALNFQNILKPYLSNGSVKVIGATTDDEYWRTIRKDKALSERFSVIDIKEPTAKQTKKILKKSKSNYVLFHGIEISENNVGVLVDLCDKFLTKDCFPRKSFKFLDYLLASKKLFSFDLPKEYNQIEKDIFSIKEKIQKSVLTSGNIPSNLQNNLLQKIEEYNNLFADYISNLPKDKLVISKKDIVKEFKSYSGISENQIHRFFNSKDKKDITKNSDKIKENIFGQNDQIDFLCKNINRSVVGFKDPIQPIGVFMLVGPTGVGKTFFAREVAKTYFSEDSFLKVDMSEYSEDHSVYRLIGANPGYAGYDDSNILLEFLEKHKEGVILFDEIEKAHPKIFDIFLQIFDDGKLSLGNGKTVDFSNYLILLTGNIGSKYFEKDNNSIGFSSKEENKQELILEEVKKNFRPEFFNRIDEVVVFNKLEVSEAREIVSREILKFIAYANPNLKKVSYDDDLIDFLIEKSDFKTYGGRNIKKTVQRVFFNPLSEFLLSNNYKNKRIRTDLQEESIVFTIEK